MFKTFVAVTLISNTFNITMAIFDVGQWVVRQSGAIINGSTAIDDNTLLMMEIRLAAMDIGPLMAIFLQSFIVQIGIYILSVAIFVIINGNIFFKFLIHVTLL